MVCVPMAYLTEFLIECMQRGIVANGSTFTHGFDAQWFYI